ncbi:hypothetical protein DPMN_178596 [Dreissena polymorpha]|uniref:Uncharacterized protein n=1 Tax=Dreissena polymorpha TaxID=45954 RepID=A0A9D4EAX0_DREPO|nr:hypothetical protein DPMN_178596 [Dreissena polymorpha]
MPHFRLKQRGVVDNILQQIQFEGSTSKPATHMRGEHMLENIADRKSRGCLLFQVFIPHFLLF